MADRASQDTNINDSSLINTISNQILNNYDSSVDYRSNVDVSNLQSIELEMRGTNIIGNDININTVQDSQLQSKMNNNLTEAVTFANGLQNGLTNNMTNNTDFQRSFDTEGSPDAKDCNVLSVCSPLIDLSGFSPAASLIKGGTEILKDLFNGNKKPNKTDLESIMYNKNEADAQFKTAIHSAYHFHYNNSNSNTNNLKISLIADGNVNNNTINISTKQLNRNVINTALELTRTSQTDNTIVNDFQNALDNDLNSDIKYKQKNSKNPFGIFGSILYTILGFIGFIIILSIIPKIIQMFNTNSNNTTVISTNDGVSKGFNNIFSKDVSDGDFKLRVICIGVITTCIPLYVIFSHIIASETKRIRMQKPNILPVHDSLFIIFYVLFCFAILVVSIILHGRICL